MREAIDASTLADTPILIDKFLDHADECDLDCLADPDAAALWFITAEGTDLAALAARYVSVTPLRLDRTDEVFSETLVDTLK